jgi:hypothetical protein
MLLTSSGISDFHIVFAQYDLFFIELAQARPTGETEPPRQTVACNGMLRPAYASAQHAMQGKLRQSTARPIPLLI